MYRHVRLPSVVCVAVLAIGGAVGATPVAAAAAVTCAAGTSLGVMGPLTGDNRAFGVALSRGAALAVARHNKAHPGCVVKLVKVDTQGDPAKAPAAATKLRHDPKVLGVVGPAFSGETSATGAYFADAGLVTLTPSATNPALSTHRWATFHRGTANDSAVGAIAARFLTSTAKLKRIVVVRDDSDYGATSAAAVGRHLGKRKVGAATIRSGNANYKAAAKVVLAKQATGVYFAGYDYDAAYLVRQLRASGYKGKFVAGDGAYSPLFVKTAGAAGRGAYIVAGVAPRGVSKSLASSYRTAYKSSIVNYTPESFDVTNVLLAGIDKGATTRTALLARVRAYNAKGLTQTFRFTRTGELVTPSAWAYVVGKGALATYRHLH